MTDIPLSDDATYEEIEGQLARSQQAILDICQAHMQAVEPSGYSDIYGLAIARRALALSAGYRALVLQANSIAALPIVRMQLDTALRLYAAFFVDDREIFCRQVFDGQQVNKIRARDGKLMTDAYLLSRVAERFEWITNVYKVTSGHVHFSGHHLLEIFRRDDDSGFARIVISPHDEGRSQNEFHEPSRCILHINWMINVALEDWFERT